VKKTQSTVGKVPVDSLVKRQGTSRLTSEEDTEYHRKGIHIFTSERDRVPYERRIH